MLPWTWSARQPPSFVKLFKNKQYTATVFCDFIFFCLVFERLDLQTLNGLKKQKGESERRLKEKDSWGEEMIRNPAQPPPSMMQATGCCEDCLLSLQL